MGRTYQLHALFPSPNAISDLELAGTFENTAQGATSTLEYTRNKTACPFSDPTGSLGLSRSGDVAY
jgi:hypothetical protein